MAKKPVMSDKEGPGKVDCKEADEQEKCKFHYK